MKYHESKNYYESSDNRSIEDVLSDVSDVCVKQIMFNSDSVAQCHKLNYHGFKRVHRHLSKKFNSMFLELLSDSINKYDVIPETHSQFVRYKVNSLKEHLYNRLGILENDIKIIGELSKEFFYLTGVMHCEIQKIQACLFKSFVKTKRAIKRFEDNNWLQHDMYVYDCKLHEKMKKVEEKEDNRKE